MQTESDYAVDTYVGFVDGVKVLPRIVPVPVGPTCSDAYAGNSTEIWDLVWCRFVDLIHFGDHLVTIVNSLLVFSLKCM